MLGDVWLYGCADCWQHKTDGLETEMCAGSSTVSSPAVSNQKLDTVPPSLTQQTWQPTALQRSGSMQEHTAGESIPPTAMQQAEAVNEADEKSAL